MKQNATGANPEGGEGGLSALWPESVQAWALAQWLQRESGVHGAGWPAAGPARAIAQDCGAAGSEGWRGCEGKSEMDAMQEKLAGIVLTVAQYGGGCVRCRQRATRNSRR